MNIRDNYTSSKEDFEEYYKKLDSHVQEFPQIYLKYDYIKKSYVDDIVEISYQFWVKSHECGFILGYENGFNAGICAADLGLLCQK